MKIDFIVWLDWALHLCYYSFRITFGHKNNNFFQRHQAAKAPTMMSWGFWINIFEFCQAYPNENISLSPSKIFHDTNDKFVFVPTNTCDHMHEMHESKVFFVQLFANKQKMTWWLRNCFCLDFNGELVCCICLEFTNLP